MVCFVVVVVELTVGLMFAELWVVLLLDGLLGLLVGWLFWYCWAVWLVSLISIDCVCCL